MSLSSLEGKGALITGGGSGISLGLAKSLRAKGVSLLLCDLALHKDAVEWLKIIERDGGPTVLFQRTDVTQWDQIEAAFDFFEEQLKKVPDIVVPGAGIYEASCPGFWDDRDAASHYKLFDVNLIHPIKLSRIAIRRMQKAQAAGVILHISSVVAQKTNIVLPLYAASKAGISHFIRCMAPLESMCGIRVVGVAPGVVDTPLFRDSPEALEHMDLTKDFALPPEEVVRAMVALITDSKYAAGTVLEVGDLGYWREVHLLNDSGPSGRSVLPRSKAKEAVKLIEDALKKDAKLSSRL